MTATLTDPNISTVNAIAFTPDGFTLDIGTSDSTDFNLWDTRTQKITATLTYPGIEARAPAERH
jgi:WD40 repeat protein